MRLDGLPEPTERLPESLVVPVDSRHQQLDHDVEDIAEPFVEPAARFGGDLEVGDLALELGQRRACEPVEDVAGGLFHRAHRVQLTSIRQITGFSLPSGARSVPSTRSITRPPYDAISAAISSGSAEVRACGPKNVGFPRFAAVRNSRNVWPPDRPTIEQKRHSPGLAGTASASNRSRADTCLGPGSWAKRAPLVRTLYGDSMLMPLNC